LDAAMRAAFLLTLALAACAKAPAAPPGAGAPRPVVVELFTSQGCSSCPPADEALARYAADPRVVAISRPITYWDDLGWRDTLARQANTDLQRAYVARGVADEAYTPQAVIQGETALIGGRTGAIHRAVDEAAARPGPRLGVARNGGGRLLTLVGAVAHGAVIRLLALRARVPVAIGRGENRGATVTYVNVVVDERVIGAWRGGAFRLTIPSSLLRVANADRYAIIVQEPRAGPILAAGYL
jgi:hypothetical protein